MSARTKKTKYGQFCPIAMATEIVCSRWTPLVLRELISGSTRFNDIRRGVPRMSPSLLSKRLKELQSAGVVTAERPDSRSPVEYRLTDAGNELRDTVMSLGMWGQRWIESSLSLRNLDASLLMWDMRRNLACSFLPQQRCTVRFEFPDAGARPNEWWLVVEADTVDLCAIDPGFDIDLFVRSSLRSMTAVWMGVSTLQSEIDAGHIELTGNRAVAQSMQKWLGLSPFASERNRADELARTTGRRVPVRAMPATSPPRTSRR